MKSFVVQSAISQISSYTHCPALPFGTAINTTCFLRGIGHLADRDLERKDIEAKLLLVSFY